MAVLEQRAQAGSPDGFFSDTLDEADPDIAVAIGKELWRQQH